MSPTHPSPPLVNQDGQTELHMLLLRPSTATVESACALLHKFPGAVQVTDVYGRTPLSLALRRGCQAAIVRHLFEAHPEALVQTDFAGESPLDLLYHPSKDTSLLELVMDLQPSLSMHEPLTFSSKPLLHRICASRSWSLPDPATSTSAAPCSWHKFLITLRAAYRHLFCNDADTPGTAPELHMALHLELPALVLQDLCRAFPDQVSMPIATSRPAELWPLHIVLTQARYGKNHKGAAGLIRTMLQLYPDAVQQRIPSSQKDGHKNDSVHNNTTLHEEGMWPLHAALRAGYTWSTGIGELVTWAPDILHNQADDVVSQLPWQAFQVAATCAQLHYLGRPPPPPPVVPDSVETIYHLLRQRPLV